MFQAFQISALFSNALNDKFVFIQIWDNLYFHIFLLKPLCDLLFMLTTEVSVKHIAEEKNLMFFIQRLKASETFFLNNIKSKKKSQVLLKILTWKWSCYCLDVLYSWFGLPFVIFLDSLNCSQNSYSNVAMCSSSKEDVRKLRDNDQ